MTTKRPHLYPMDSGRQTQLRWCATAPFINSPIPIQHKFNRSTSRTLSICTFHFFARTFASITQWTIDCQHPKLERILSIWTFSLLCSHFRYHPMDYRSASQARMHTFHSARFHLSARAFDTTHRPASVFTSFARNCYLMAYSNLVR